MNWFFLSRNFLEEIAPALQTANEKLIDRKERQFVEWIQTLWKSTCVASRLMTKWTSKHDKMMFTYQNISNIYRNMTPCEADRTSPLNAISMLFNQIQWITAITIPLNGITMITIAGRHTKSTVAQALAFSFEKIQFSQTQTGNIRSIP